MIYWHAAWLHHDRACSRWYSVPEKRRLAGFYGLVALLHGLGWGLLLYYSQRYANLIGLGLVAYLFGLRHAFDADHIAAIDDSVRYMTQAGDAPIGTGFFFSAGHSTIVLLLAAAITAAAEDVKHALPALSSAGNLLGTAISGVFLCAIGVLNLLVLVDIIDVFRRPRTHHHDRAEIDVLLSKRGFMYRLFGNRIHNRILHSWQLYPIGMLFGLGFDTATEIGLLAMTAAASAVRLPAAAILSLPILFAAGMSLMDTTDGVLMCKVYNWTLVNPRRKVFYNAVTTGLGVAVALGIGILELAQVLIQALHLHGAIVNSVADLGIGTIGFVVLALFIVAWGGSIAVWKFGHVKQVTLPRVAEARDSRSS
ncbi:MAG TPA: HoxN/HupN/NixA family nickel/cobalt transporter [Rhodanobacteraceae bacterium]